LTKAEVVLLSIRAYAFCRSVDELKVLMFDGGVWVSIGTHWSSGSVQKKTSTEEP